MRYLIIPESPNKCVTIRGLLKGTKYEKAVVMASVGHICEIADNRKSYHNTGIHPDNNFEMDLKVNSSKHDIVTKLKEQVKFADVVYLFQDNDREGFFIAWTLKKFLKIPDSKCRRAVTHEITKKAVLEALDNPVDMNENMVQAAMARSSLDKLLGYRLSPIGRRSVGAKSCGRCQSVGLEIVCEREKEILNFKPETYYDLFLNFKKNSTPFKAKYIGTAKDKVDRIKVKADADKIVDECNKGKYSIKDIVAREITSNPKLPFTTSTFQQEVCNRLGISVKSAMFYAQKLFEGIQIGADHVALVTYLRTDSTEIAPDFIPVLESYVKTNYGSTYFNPVKVKKAAANSQNGHECFRVIDLEMTPDKLTSYITDDKLIKVYSIIYQRTLQLAFKPAIIRETNYTIENGQHLFNISSRELLFDGYKKVYSYEKKEEPTVKESFIKGEELQETKLDLQEKQTQPPKRYKQGSLIKELESNGVGRPSTFQTIVDTILSPARGYCVEKDGHIIPTELGMKLADFLVKSFNDIININYTADMEKKLDSIADGKLSRIDFLKEFLDSMEATIKKVVPVEKASPASKEICICPVCKKGHIVPRFARRGPNAGHVFYACDRYPDCKTAYSKLEDIPKSE